MPERISPSGAQSPTEVTKAFIDARRGAHGVGPICSELPIAPSTYHESKAQEANCSRLPTHVHRDAEVCKQIGRVYDENVRGYTGFAWWGVSADVRASRWHG